MCFPHRSITPATGTGWLRLAHAEQPVYWTMVGQERLARLERLRSMLEGCGVRVEPICLADTSSDSSRFAL